MWVRGVVRVVLESVSGMLCPVELRSVYTIAHIPYYMRTTRQSCMCKNDYSHGGDFKYTVANLNEIIVA